MFKDAERGQTFSAQPPKAAPDENLLSLALARQVAGTLTEEFMAKVRAAQDEKSQSALKSQPPAESESEHE